MFLPGITACHRTWDNYFIRQVNAMSFAMKAEWGIFPHSVFLFVLCSTSNDVMGDLIDEQGIPTDAGIGTGGGFWW